MDWLEDNRPGLLLLLVGGFVLLARQLLCTRDRRSHKFRRLSLQFHPERITPSCGWEAGDSRHSAFAVIAEAYEVLSNRLRRAIYDQFGEASVKKYFHGPEGCVEPYVFHGEPLQTYRKFFGTESPYADLLDVLANQELQECPEPPAKKKDEPVLRSLPLTLTEVFYGGIKKMKIQRIVLAEEDKDKTAPTTISQEKILSISIMPGMPSGVKIVFPEEGDEGPLNIPADVIFVTEDKPHEMYRRDGSNLRMTVELELWEALTGTIVTVTTIDERTLRVPITSVITPKYEKIILGEGLPLVEAPERRGRLIIDFSIRFPTYLTPESKEYVRMAFRREKGAGDNSVDLEADKQASRQLLFDGKMYTRTDHFSTFCKP